jgi:hypothetical protein
MIYEIERYYIGKFNEEEALTNIACYFSNYSKYFEAEIRTPKLKRKFKGERKLSGDIPSEDPVTFVKEKLNYLMENSMFLNGFKLFLYKDRTHKKINFLFQFDGFSNTFLDLTDEEFKSFQVFLKENSLPEDLFCREDQIIKPKLKGIWKILGITGKRYYTPLEYKEIFKEK